MYLCERIKELTKQRFGYSFKQLEIEVEETPGQSAIYIHKEEL